MKIRCYSEIDSKKIVKMKQKSKKQIKHTIGPLSSVDKHVIVYLVLCGFQQHIDNMVLSFNPCDRSNISYVING